MINVDDENRSDTVLLYPVKMCYETNGKEDRATHVVPLVYVIAAPFRNLINVPT